MIDAVAFGLTGQTEQKERTEFRERTVKGENKPRCEQTERNVSSGTHHMINLSRPSPCFSYCKCQKLGVDAWEQGYQLTTLRVVIPMKSLLVQRQSPISHSYTVDDQRLQIDPTKHFRATENLIRTPDFSQQPMFTLKSQDGEDPAHLIVLSFMT